MQNKSNTQLIVDTVGTLTAKTGSQIGIYSGLCNT